VSKLSAFRYLQPSVFEIVNSVIEFLNNADNRALLGWLGGGLATFAGGLWVVLRYFLDRPKNKPKEFKAKEDASELHPFC
jgi:hypothetical protein